jgi:hypothetical protein
MEEVEQWHESPFRVGFCRSPKISGRPLSRKISALIKTFPGVELNRRQDCLRNIKN